jgi:hypothetical protein
MSRYAIWDWERRSVREQRQHAGGAPEPYQHGDVPDPLRTRIRYLLDDAFPHEGITDRVTHSGFAEYWFAIHDTWCRAVGSRSHATSGREAATACKNWLDVLPTGEFLDLLELVMRFIDRGVRHDFEENELAKANIHIPPDEAIATLNRLFQEHGVGFRYVEGEIVRVDSEFIHAEMVEPAIALLHAAAFKGASDEFMRAHKRYREGAYQDATASALKSVESTLKAICDQRGWAYQARDSAGALVELVLKHGLLPGRFQEQFASLEQLLIGLATASNPAGDRERRAATAAMPSYLAAYALHQAAANIVLLVEAHYALP